MEMVAGLKSRARREDALMKKEKAMSNSLLSAQGLLAKGGKRKREGQ